MSSNAPFAASQTPQQQLRQLMVLWHVNHDGPINWNDPLPQKLIKSLIENRTIDCPTLSAMFDVLIERHGFANDGKLPLIQLRHFAEQGGFISEDTTSLEALITSAHRLELLKNLGARKLLDPHAVDACNQDVIIYASSTATGCGPCVQYLAKYGFRIAGRDHNGTTLLHNLLYWNEWNDEAIALAAKSLEVGLNINSVGWNGHTPLHIAALRGKTDAAEWLIRHGANPELCNSQNRSPEQEAATHGHNDLACLIQHHRISLSEAKQLREQSLLQCESLAELGRLAMQLIEEGKMQIEGQAVLTHEDFLRIARNTNKKNKRL